MIESGAFHKLSYGLFVLTTKEGEKDNGCIINTAIQVTDNPKCISIAVNKQNYSCGMIERTGKFNLSVLSESTPFSVFERFGFSSGRDRDKFDGFTNVDKSENGINYLTEYANAYMSCEVVFSKDCGSHILFVATVTKAKVLSDAPSVTYAYYFANIKPKPKAVKSEGKVYVCSICGYVYDEEKENKEFENLTSDWACPWCKHPRADFNLQK